MGKLPDNLAKAPFDNPLRSTTGKVLPIDPEPKIDRVEPPLIIATDPPSDVGDEDAADVLVHRMSVRFTDDQWKALQNECHQRRMKGEHTNVAELLRILVDDWRTGC